jgi:hypothetical protein
VRKLTIGFWAAQALAALVMLTAAAIDVESILWTGPILSIIGLLHAVVTRPLISWATLFVGLSGPLVCALIAVCIAVFNWSPDEAESPIIAIMSLYLFIFFPVTAITLGPGIKWRLKDAPLAPVWQFSLKSMLFAMTAICLVIAAARLVSNAFRDDDVVFNGFALVVVTLCALVVWRFVAYRRRITDFANFSFPPVIDPPTKQGCEHDI